MEGKSIQCPENTLECCSIFIQYSQGLGNNALNNIWAMTNNFDDIDRVI
jgi:hypothetical protein